jgi:glycosyltransferase involved in cell wall biosynthesis
MPELSVVIPTYNRADTLRRTLTAYNIQSVKSGAFEVIVVDDGSDDDTSTVVLECQQRVSYVLRYLRQRNQGPGKARNMAFKVARSPLILITGDDIVPHEDLLLRHIAAHTEKPSPSHAVLGKVEWSTECEPNFLMHYVTELTSLQFGYHLIKNHASASYRFFYTSNISLKTETLLSSGGFHPDFIHAAFEDMELGYRLEQTGLNIVYKPSAIGFHNHRLTLESFSERQFKAGQMDVVFLKLHPELDHSRFLQIPKRDLKSLHEKLLDELRVLSDLATSYRLDHFVHVPAQTVPEELRPAFCKYLERKLNLHKLLGTFDLLMRGD